MSDQGNGQDGKVWASGIGRRDALILGGGGAIALSGMSTHAAIAKASARPAMAEIGHGKLRGATIDGVSSFKGVPYGASTGGGNRFFPPQPISKWAGVRDATKLGNQCPQINPDFPEWLDSSAQSEDCLYLNVWTPECPKSTGKLPVMVWLHGGGYAFGSAGAPLYDGSNLAREGDVVIVGVNHRLNIFGFSYFETTDARFASSGNATLLDLVEALRWVRDNIAAFGGDPGNVTIFGESGGGCKVNALLGMPKAHGLFHKAIVQSGRLLDIRTPEVASRITDRVYSKLGIKRGDIAALQKVPTALLVKLYEPVSAEVSKLGPYLAYGPTVDGVVFKAQPWATGSPEYSRNIPVIIGTNLDETIGWVGDDIHKPYPSDEAIAAAAIKAVRVTRVSTGAMIPMNAMVEIVAASHKELPHLPQSERLIRVSTDAGFRAAAIHQSELCVQSGDAPVYAYEYRWRTPCYGGKWSLHGADVPTVFGHRHYGVAYDGRDSDAQRNAADKDGLFFKMQQRMMQAWAAFARSGNPSTPALQWPAYDLTSRATMTFDGETKIENDPRPILARATARSYKS